MLVQCLRPSPMALAPSQPILFQLRLQKYTRENKCMCTYAYDYVAMWLV